MSTTTDPKTAVAPATPRALAPLPVLPIHPLLDVPAPRTRAPMVFGLIVFVLFVVGFGAWAGLAPLAEASITPGLIKPGDPIFDLIPTQDRLMAEVNIQPNDIDVVYPGLRAEVRLPAFKQRLVPHLHGHGTWVAADVTVNEQARQQYYQAYVMIDPDHLSHLPNVFLTAGMPVEAHVQIGQRTFFRYVTQPLTDSFTRAFREQ